MDALRGIGSVAAQGVNQALGTNIGGVSAGATLGPGQRQQAAMQINQGLAAKQAEQLSKQYIRSVTSFLQQAGVQSPSQLAATTQAAIKKEIDQIIYEQLLSYTGVRDLNQLVPLVDKSNKQTMLNFINQINTARRGLYSLPDPQNPQESLHYWTEITKAASGAKNLLSFGKQKTAVGPATVGGDIAYDTASGQFTYKGQPYDANDPVQKAAMSQWMKLNYKKP